MNNIHERLSAPFHPSQIEWRVQRCGMSNNGPWAMVLAYVTNRAIQDRLDDVFTPMHWQNQYKEMDDGGILCGISVFNVEEKIWVTKWDGSEKTDIESIKGGLSASMKRAAVQWGIGRYLYALTEAFAQCSVERPPREQQHWWKKAYDKKTNTNFYWAIPRLPGEALPEGFSYENYQ